MFALICQPACVYASNIYYVCASVLLACVVPLNVELNGKLYNLAQINALSLSFCLPTTYSYCLFPLYTA